jgi:hypothetical protein
MTTTTATAAPATPQHPTDLWLDEAEATLTAALTAHGIESISATVTLANGVATVAVSKARS